MLSQSTRTLLLTFSPIVTAKDARQLREAVLLWLQYTREYYSVEEIMAELSEVKRGG